ncbi:MAG: hypothetical protein EXQ53_06250 [Acidobacteria bacterium]|nr:hypothetical protein [Acidobacteriota bacterium]
MTELFRALAALAEAPTAATPRLADAIGLTAAPTAAEYTDLFVFQLPPYASVYLGPEGMVGGDARDRIAGFWRALGATPPPEPDHLVTLLGAYADLLERHEAAGDGMQRHQVQTTRRAFLWEHLLSWLPSYLIKAQEIAPGAFRQWAALLMEALLEEAREAGAEPVMPLHLREAPPLGVGDQAPFTEPWSLIPALLTPVRSGMILTRADLIRGARSMGVGVGVGDRRTMLRALVEQDPERTVRWLSDEARRWTQRHAELVRDLGPVAEFWQERAEATAEILDPRGARLYAVPGGP